jgi:hypothetical protein
MPSNIHEKLREMSAQQQLIEQKKREIELKLAEEKYKKMTETQTPSMWIEILNSVICNHYLNPYLT